MADIEEDILRTYLLATAPFEYTESAPTQGSDLGGSNNWAISGDRTASGRPILANDPHRAMSLPSLRYVVHLECPTFSVIGAGEPALPGLVDRTQREDRLRADDLPDRSRKTSTSTQAPHPEDDRRYLL